MNWQDRKRYSRSTSKDGQINFYIYKNKEGQFYVEGTLTGGMKHNLPFKKFSTVEEAKSFVELNEAEREEKNVRLRDQDTAIKF